MDQLPTFSVAVPVYWPDHRWSKFLYSIADQSLPPTASLVVSSAAYSRDLTLAQENGFRCISIEQIYFDHAGTRQFAVNLLSPNSDIIIFLTQDALLASPDAFAQLIRVFTDKSVGAAWGRQIPHLDSTPIAAHARHYNYPEKSRIVRKENVSTLGIKAAFCSNSFAAYRISALNEVGGFLSPTPLGEDMSAAGRLLNAGYGIAYVAEAVVQHAHNYTTIQEFSRYFDTGAFHALNPWLFEHFGSATDEGRRFVSSEISFLAKNSPFSIPQAILNTIGKYLGYQLGKHFAILPCGIATRLGMNKTYWKNRHALPISLSDR